MSIKGTNWLFLALASLISAQATGNQEQYQPEDVQLDPVRVTATRPTKDFGGFAFNTSTGFRAVILEPVNVTRIRPTKRPDSDTGTDDDKTCNPVVIQTGNKVKTETDFLTNGENPLVLVRRYNQLSGFGAFGSKWTSSIDARLKFTYTDDQNCRYVPGSTTSCATANIKSITAYRPTGEEVTFAFSSAQNRWIDSSSPLQYFEFTGNSWRYKAEDDSVEIYNLNGSPSSIKNQFGVGFIYSYTNGLVTSVTHNSGRRMSFTWLNNRVQTATDPAGQIYRYSYNTSGVLTGVQRPEGNSTTYHYEDTNNLSRLTGISYNGVRYSRYTYFPTSTATNSGKVKTSALEGNIELQSFNYGLTSLGKFTEVTNVYGAKTRYDYEYLGSALKRKKVNRPAVAGCAASARITDYDNQGRELFVSSALDSYYTYTPSGQLQSVAYDASGSNRVVNSWDSAKNRINSTQRYESSALVFEQYFEYYADNLNEANRLKRITEVNRSSNGITGQTKTTDFFYTVDPSSKIVTSFTMDGPIPGTSDRVIETYNSTGDLVRTVNGLGIAEEYGGYNGRGQIGFYQDASGFRTVYTYDGMGRLAQQNNGGVTGAQTFTYRYSPLDAVSEIAESPSGLKTVNEYDAVGRLTGVVVSNPIAGGDVIGKKIFLNADSKPVRVETFVNGSVVSAVAASYNDAGLTNTIQQGDGQLTSFTYDGRERVSSVTDGIGRVTTYFYEENLSEATRVVYPDSSSARFIHDAFGKTLSIFDQRGLRTNYLYDGFGQTVAVLSPDAGTTNSSFDSGGRVSSQVFGNGKAVNYSYDGLNRLTSRSGVGIVETFVYDSCSGGKGRLCKIIDQSGSTEFVYSIDGLLTKQNVVIGGRPFTFDRAYDSSKRLRTISYPSGAVVRYSYDGLSRISSVDIGSRLLGDAAGSTNLNLDALNVFIPFISNITYSPFGPEKIVTYANGDVRTSFIDFSGRINRIRTDPVATAEAVSQHLVYGFDAANQIRSIQNIADPTNSQTYNYDLLSRLQSGVGSPNEYWSYDAGGNIRTLVSGTGATTTTFNTISSVSNRIASRAIDGALTTYTYDGAGNRTIASNAAGRQSWRYDGFNRTSGFSDTNILDIPALPNNLDQVINSDFSYVVNGFNQRVLKSGAGGGQYYLYGTGGEMLVEGKAALSILSNLSVDGVIAASAAPAEVLGPLTEVPTATQVVGSALTSDLNLLTNYIWVNGKVVGMMRDGQIYQIFNDHLGRPETVTDLTRLTVWRAQNRGYDRTIELDLIGSLNIGFPGQYFDKESKLYYNWNRYYDPVGGRYIQVDPEGLAAGLNPYIYVNGSPITTSDPSGLGPVAAAVCAGIVSVYEAYSAGSDIRDLNEATAGLLDQLDRIKERIDNCPAGPEGDKTRTALMGMYSKVSDQINASTSRSVATTIGGGVKDSLVSSTVCLALLLAEPL